MSPTSSFVYFALTVVWRTYHSFQYYALCYVRFKFTCCCHIWATCIPRLKNRADLLKILL